MAHGSKTRPRIAELQLVASPQGLRQVFAFATRPSALFARAASEIAAHSRPLQTGGANGQQYARTVRRAWRIVMTQKQYVVTITAEERAYLSRLVSAGKLSA